MMPSDCLLGLIYPGDSPYLTLNVAQLYTLRTVTVTEVHANYYLLRHSSTGQCMCVHTYMYVPILVH